MEPRKVRSCVHCVHTRSRLRVSGSSACRLGIILSIHLGSFPLGREPLWAHHQPLWVRLWAHLFGGLCLGVGFGGHTLPDLLFEGPCLLFVCVCQNLHWPVETSLSNGLTCDDTRVSFPTALASPRAERGSGCSLSSLAPSCSSDGALVGVRPLWTDRALVRSLPFGAREL